MTEEKDEGLPQRAARDKSMVVDDSQSQADKTDLKT